MEGYERIGSSNSSKYETLPDPEPHKVHKKRIYAIISLFLISLVSFVSQTELTSYLYNGLNFNQPYLLLYLTHSSWIYIWPIQVITIAFYKHFKRCHKHGLRATDISLLKVHLIDSVKNQHKKVFKTSGILIEEHYTNDSDYPKNILQFVFSKSIKSIIKKIFLLTLILNFAGCSWYFAMAVSPASDVTAIYNCSAFAALVLAIPILQEKFTWLKLSSVLIAIFGVFFVSYSGNTDAETSEFPYRILGDVVIAFGALFYGLYEVLYKKLACPPEDSVSARRQVAFSNFCASLLGCATICIVWVLLVFVHVTGISEFNIKFTGYTWLIIILSIVSNLVFSLSFLSLMSLTSPVLSAVSSLVTILFVGVFEWLLFGITLTFEQLIGDLLIVVGFGVLSYAYWNEINAEDVEDDQTDVDDV